MGVFSFAGAGSYGIGAYAGGDPGDPPATWPRSSRSSAWPCSSTRVIGLVLGLLIARLNGLYLAMATVAFDLIIGVIAINGGELTGGSTGLYGVITDFTMPTMFT